MKRYLPKRRRLSDAAKIAANLLQHTRFKAFRRASLLVFPFCQWCAEPLDAETATADHIQPRSKGGSNKWDNLALSCERCNHRKGSSDWGLPRFRPHYFLAEIRHLATKRKPLWNASRMVTLSIPAPSDTQTKKGGSHADSADS